MLQRILMVCTGNVCRSPMAGAVLGARLDGTGARVESAGLVALAGRPAEPLAVEVLRARGLDLSGHRARQLTAEMVLASDLVVVMERAQLAGVLALCPPARGRVQLLGRAGPFDVPDPYGRSRAAFEEALALIERGLDDLERAIRPGRRARKAS